jgi:acetyl esterase/lipase
MAPEAAWRARFRAPRMSLPKWARDDPERLLYTSNAEGKWELYAWDRRDGSHRRVTDRAEGTRVGRLDPSGLWIWWFDDEKGSEFGRWMIEPFDGGAKPVPAATGLPAAYDAGLALARGFAIVGSSDEHGTTVYLVRTEGEGEPPAELYHHAQDARVGGLSRDEDLVCIVHSEHGDNRHPALRVLALNGPDPVAEMWDGPGLGLWPAGWSRVSADRRMLVLHERRDLLRPMLWRPETAETIDLEIDLPGEVGAGWYPDGGSVLLTHDHGGRVELFRLALPTGPIERIDSPPGTVTEARVHPGGGVWYAWSDAATAPEIRDGRGVLVRPPADGGRAPAGVPFRSRDVAGQPPVPVFVAQPDEGVSGPRPYPTILIVHGGPEAHDRDAFSPAVQAWVDHGFAVVLANYRGSTGYGKAWRDALEGNPGLTELQDVATVHDWAVSSGLADPNHVILSGASWGGYLTLLGLGTQPERWSLGIAGVPVADYVAAYEDEMEPLKAMDRALFGGAPDQVPEAYRKRSPITFVESVRVPVMILAGANDPRCPIRQIENYISRLTELGKPHDVYRFQAGHGSLVVDESIRQLEAQIAFAARHLGTSPPR